MFSQPTRRAGGVSLPIRLLLVYLLACLNTATAANLSGDQQEIAERYQRLEAVALRIADLADDADGDRAKQIRDAIGKARELGIEERFDRVVTLLESERLAEARSGQSELAEQLEELLRLVMADPLESQLEEERRRLEKLSAEVRQAIRSQRSLRARTEREESQQDSKELAEEQSQLADYIERLLELTPDESSSGEAKDSESSDGPPSLGGRITQAEGAMRQASKRIGSGKQGEATEQQRKAQRELEAAQRLVEKALRQLREEEQQRRLASLSDRLREMLAEETVIVKNTTDLVSESTKPNRTKKIAAAKLADRQAHVTVAADRALRLIEEDGKSLIFAEAMRQATSDMRVVESRFRQTRLDALTQQLAQDIVLTIEEMLAAVDQALDDLEQQRQSNQSGGPAGGGDPSLVGRLAELRMLRSVQARILRKTNLWQKAAGSSQELETLALQQQQIAEAARHAAQFEKPAKAIEKPPEHPNHQE